MVAVPSIGRADQISPQRAAPEADATRRLYELHARQIYAYCLQQLRDKEEAEDATQATFLNAFRGLQRGVHPEFELAWLYKIAQNVCLTRQRSSSRRRRVESPNDLVAMQDVIPARQVDADELLGLPEALSEMPEQQRRALLLREWQGLSYKEIAAELELSQAAVETLLFRARRSLAAGLSEEPKRGRLQKAGDAGSLLALVKSLLVTGGLKVAATAVTMAAVTVVAATPVARHAVEHAIAPAKAPAPVVQAPTQIRPQAAPSVPGATRPVAHVPHEPVTPSGRLAAAVPAAAHSHSSVARVRQVTAPVAHSPVSATEAPAPAEPTAAAAAAEPTPAEPVPQTPAAAPTSAAVEKTSTPKSNGNGNATKDSPASAAAPPVTKPQGSPAAEQPGSGNGNGNANANGNAGGNGNSNAGGNGNGKKDAPVLPAAVPVDVPPVAVAVPEVTPPVAAALPGHGNENANGKGSGKKP